MKDIKEYSDIELKAIGYDLAVQAEKIQGDLKVISLELARRAEESKPKVVEPEVVKAE